MRPSRIVVASFALVAALLAPVAVTPAVPAQAFPTIVIPTCEQLLPASRWDSFFGPRTVLTSGTVTGASNARQAEIINSGVHRNCTWTDAKGMRRVTVSVAWIDIFEEREIRAWYVANHIPLTGLGGPPVAFALVAHSASRVEAHYTDTMFFIAINDRGFGSLGASMQDSYGALTTLNPWMSTA